MRNLFSNYVLNCRVFKNRIVMPPMVCPGWSDDNGFVSDKHVRHYEAHARGELMIVYSYFPMVLQSIKLLTQKELTIVYLPNTFIL